MRLASMAGRLAVVYLVLGLIAIMSLVVVVPPYQFGDEVNHFKRIIQLSKGELHGQKIGIGLAGGSINEGVHVTWLAYIHIPTHPEAKVSSVTQVNSIRPVILASLLAKGEAQVTRRIPRDGALASEDSGRGKLDDQNPNGHREGQGWLETEGTEGSLFKQGDLLAIRRSPLARASPVPREQESERP